MSELMREMNAVSLQVRSFEIYPSFTAKVYTSAADAGRKSVVLFTFSQEFSKLSSARTMSAIAPASAAVASRVDTALSLRMRNSFAIRQPTAKSPSRNTGNTYVNHVEKSRTRFSSATRAEYTPSTRYAITA